MSEYKEIDERDIYKKIAAISAKNNIIRSSFFELLDKCNFSCEYCYIKGSYDKIMNKEDAFNYSTQLRNYGCIWLTLSGGEPLLHPNFSEIYLFAYNLGFSISVLTNGYLINEEICELFSKYPPRIVDITLYGTDDNSYDKFVKIEGAFMIFKKNLYLLKKHNIKFELKTTLTTETYYLLDRYLDFSEKFGVKFRYDTFVVPQISDKSEWEKLRLAPSQVLEYDLNKEGASIKKGQDWLINKLNDEVLCEEDNCYNCELKVFCKYCPARFLLETGSKRMSPWWNCEYGRLLNAKL